MHIYRSTLHSVLAIASLTSTSAHAGLFGPDSVPLSSEDLRQKLQAQTVALSVQSVPLEFKTKGAAVGGFLLGMIAGSAMASGGAPRPGMNAQQLVQNMDAMTKSAAQVGSAIGNSAAKMIDAQALTAGKQANDGPIALIAPQLQAAFEKAYASKWEAAKSGVFGRPEGGPTTSIYLGLSQSVWLVDFSMLSSDYELRYKLDVNIGDAAAKVVNHTANCEGTYERKMTEEAWRKDDSQAIADASKEIAERCLDRFLASLNIPRVTAGDGVAGSEASRAPAVPHDQSDVKEVEAGIRGS